ncbi:hypothetical protein, partial [Klebsiella pneumoniae]|uniref:hypothetical protein n=1 Tax=Klebsiella pneumoniae TaxID=573 RepID=UPI0040556076
SLELMTPVDYILRESKNCNMWWTHTGIRIMLPPECQLVPDAPDKEYNPGNQNAEFYYAEQDSI